jgi:hypothetical protein
MKITHFLFLTFFFTVNLFSQDVIIMNNSKRIEVVVLEVGANDVKYVKYDNPNGPTYLVSKADINYIAYSNGSSETFDEAKKNVAQKPQKALGNYEKEYKNILRFKPLVTIIAMAYGIGEIDLQYVRYVHPKIGIPVELDLFFANGGFGAGLMSGIEAVPITHRQKSGLFLNFLVGGVFVSTGDVMFRLNSNIGYQLCTKKGFVFNAALGPNLMGGKLSLSFSIDFGFGF